MNVRVLMVGAGGMARAHAEAFQQIDHVELIGVVEPDAERGAQYASDFGIATRYSSVEQALANCDAFDAVCNATPDALHCETTLPLLHAGKHVLCEKPLAVNAVDAQRMADAAAAADVINMVNLSYRRVPIARWR